MAVDTHIKLRHSIKHNRKVETISESAGNGRILTQTPMEMEES